MAQRNAASNEESRHDADHSQFKATIDRYREKFKDHASEVVSKQTDDLDSPRTSFSKKRMKRNGFMEHLMMMLTTKKLSKIKSLFMDEENYSRLIGLDEFVLIFMEVIPDFLLSSELSRNQIHVTRITPFSGRLTKEEYTSCLSQLFHDIDINGDGCVEWKEFTLYILEKSRKVENHAYFEQMNRFQQVPFKVQCLSGSPNKAFDSDKRTDSDFFGQESSDLGISSTDASICPRGVAKKSSSLKFTYHINQISKLVYLPRYNQILATEHHSQKHFFYDPIAGHVTGINDVKYGVPMDTVYIPSQEYIITSTSEKQMVVNSLESGLPSIENNQLPIVKTWSTTQMHLSLCWIEKHHSLYTGSLSGGVHAWDIHTSKEKLHVTGHSDAVTCLHSMSSLDNVVSGSYDSNICIWDTFTGGKRQVLKGHKKGVYGITYSPTYRLLVSAGLDHDAFIWSPFVSTSINRLTGHKYPLVDVQSFPNSSHIITADNHGIFKVWDLRNFQCLQTFTSTDEKSNLHSLSCFVNFPTKNESSRILAATKRLVAFQEGARDKTPATDKDPVRQVIYNSADLSIMTVSNNSIRVWDVVKGLLKKDFKTLSSEYDITAVCLDKLERRIIVGNSIGEIQLYRYRTGLLLKKFTKHDGAIVSLSFCAFNKVIVSAGEDNLIRLHDDLAHSSETSVLRTMDPASTHSDKITCCAVSASEYLLASGSMDKTVKLWHFDSGKLWANLTFKDEVRCVLFPSMFNVVLVSTEDAVLHIYGTFGCRYEDQCLFRMSHGKPDISRVYPSQTFVPVFKDPIIIEDQQQELSTSFSSPTKVKDIGTMRSVLPSVPSLCTTQQSFTVHCMSWKRDGYLLFTGDEGGGVHCWDLSELFRELNLVEMNPKAVRKSTLHAINHHRRADNNRTGKNNAVSGLNLTSSKSKTLVEHVWCRYGHSATVTSLSMIEDIHCLFTSSVDQCVRGWTHHGAYQGTLLQDVLANSAAGNPDWYLQMNLQQMEQDNRGESIKLLLRLQTQRERTMLRSTLMATPLPIKQTFDVNTNANNPRANSACVTFSDNTTSAVKHQQRTAAAAAAVFNPNHKGEKDGFGRASLKRMSFQAELASSTIESFVSTPVSAILQPSTPKRKIEKRTSVNNLSAETQGFTTSTSSSLERNSVKSGESLTDSDKLRLCRRKSALLDVENERKHFTAERHENHNGGSSSSNITAVHNQSDILQSPISSSLPSIYNTKSRTAPHGGIKSLSRSNSLSIIQEGSGPNQNQSLSKTGTLKKSTSSVSFLNLPSSRGITSPLNSAGAEIGGQDPMGSMGPVENDDHNDNRIITIAEVPVEKKQDNRAPKKNTEYAHRAWRRKPTLKIPSVMKAAEKLAFALDMLDDTDGDVEYDSSGDTEQDKEKHRISVSERDKQDERWLKRRTSVGFQYHKIAAGKQLQSGRNIQI